MNNRPRRTLGWDTPLQVFARMLAQGQAAAAVH